MRPRSVLIVMALCGVASAQPTVDDIPVPARLEAANELVENVISEALAAARAAPTDADALYQLGRAYHANGYKEEAEACYLLANELGIDDAVLWHLVAHVRQDLGDYDGGLEAADRSIEHDPTNAYIHWRRGDWLQDLGDLDGAEAAYKMALMRQADHEAALMGLVRVYLARREPDIAIGLIESASLLEGLNGLYGHMLLASAYRQQGRMEEAAAETARGRGARVAFPDPRVNDLHELSTGYVNEMNRILAQMRKGEHQDVLERTSELRRHFPNDALILEYRASTLWTLGRRQDAAQTWQQAMRVDPGNHHPHLSFARTISSGSQPNSQVFNLAMQHAVRATQLNPNDAESHELVGTLHGFAGRTDAAIAGLELAVEADPKRVSALGKLGELYLRQQRYQDAFDVVQRAVRVSPDSGLMHVLLAASAVEVGQNDVASEALDDAERLMPQGHPMIEQLRVRVPRQPAGGPP